MCGIASLLRPGALSAPGARLRALTPNSTNAFFVRKCGLPHTSLGSKQNRGPLFASAQPVPHRIATHRYAPHRTAFPTPYPVYQTFCCPAQSHPQLQLLDRQKESPSPHTCGIVCQLSSFRFSILRCARFCQHFYSFVVVPTSLRQEPSLVRSCMHASCRL